MEITTEEYKGFTIAVTPFKDHGGQWDFEYRISKAGEGDASAAAVTRSQTAGGHATAEVARVAGVQVARTEVDNLLALDAAAPAQVQ